MAVIFIYKSMLIAAIGCAASFLWGLKRGHYWNNRHLGKLCIEVSAACLAVVPVAMLMHNSDYFIPVSFFIGVACSISIQGFRNSVTASALQQIGGAISFNRVVLLRIYHKIGLTNLYDAQVDGLEIKTDRQGKISGRRNYQWLSGITALVLFQGSVISVIIIWGLTEYPVRITSNHRNSSVEHISKLKIDWTEIQPYFSVTKPATEEGFAQADIKLRFLLKAKGEFGGNLHLYAFDRSGVKICPVTSPSYGCMSYDFGGIMTLFGIHDGTHADLQFWQEGETKWAQVYLPHNTDRLQLDFTHNF